MKRDQDFILLPPIYFSFYKLTVLERLFPGHEGMLRYWVLLSEGYERGVSGVLMFVAILWGTYPHNISIPKEASLLGE
ncbi:MAG: hypothetical protein PXY39_10955 [archaeon]|nr:hypothetical protein [archaeon]